MGQSAAEAFQQVGQWADFGKAVLKILEDHDDWGGDTLEEISNARRNLGLDPKED